MNIGLVREETGKGDETSIIGGEHIVSSSSDSGIVYDPVLPERFGTE